jgi:hypothetical protein
VLWCAFDGGIVCAEKEEHETDFGTILCYLLRDDLRQEDFGVFYGETGEQTYMIPVVYPE